MICRDLAYVIPEDKKTIATLKDETLPGNEKDLKYTDATRRAPETCC